MAKQQKKGAKLDTWTIDTPRKTTQRHERQTVEVELRVRYEKGNHRGEDAKSEYVVSLEDLGWAREFTGLTPQDVRTQVVAFLGRVDDVTDVEDCLIVTASGFNVNYTRAQRGKLDGEDVHRVEGHSRRAHNSMHGDPEHTEDPEDAPDYGPWQVGALTSGRKKESWQRDGQIQSIIADTAVNRAALAHMVKLVEHAQKAFAQLFDVSRIETTLSSPMRALPMPEETTEPKPRKRARRS